MKPLILFLLVCLVFPMTLQAQQSSWQWDNPLPQGNILNGLWALNKDTLYAVGDYGTIIRSSNGGLTWQVTPTAAGMLDPLFAVQFFSATKGWAVGASGQIISTTDGGVTWDYHTLPTVNDIYAVSFVSSTTGWVSGGGGIIYGTTDGGTTWLPESSKTTFNLYGFQFVNATTGWAVGAGGTIIKTTNGGTTWIPQTSGTVDPLYAVSFTSSTTGYASGAFGTILKTLNGGTTWIPQNSGTTYALFGMNFTSATTGWAVGSFGIVLKTTNGGSTWFQQSSGSYNDLEATRFISATTGWSVGDFGTILRTTDGGTTWTTQSSGVKNPINAMCFPSTTVGFAVGEEGTIIRTSDGGLSWTQLSSGVFQPLYGVYFLNNNVGWAVGDSAVILRTTNGGAAWIDANSRTDISLYSIHFANANAGWAAGDYGTILATTNGGSVWLPQNSNTTTTLLKVRFATSTVGWAVGYGGTVLKTINGGVTWQTQSSPTTQTLSSLDFIDANRLYAVGDFGTVIGSTDGGISWLPKTTGVDASLYGVVFSSATNGWAAGDDGTIIATTNGGTSWTTQNSSTPQSLWDIQLARRTSGGVLFAGGFGGTIVCSTIGPYVVRTWTGTFNTLWTTPENWNPIGIPEKGDSVFIPTTSQSPLIAGSTQQLNLTSLNIGIGAKLKIASGLASLSVKSSVKIDGTLELDSTSKTAIVTGGDFVVSITGVFNPANSTVYFTNPGSIRGNFYNVVLGESAGVHSVGNVSIRNQFITLNDIHLRAIDTLTILSNDPVAFQGLAITGPGTIKRAIRQGSTEPYRFESAVTTLRFHPTGVYPDTVTMTVYPNTIPPGLPDTAFARRYYDINVHGGNGYLADLSLRFDTTETSIPVENVGLFKDSSGVVLSMGQSDYLDSDVVAVILDSVSSFSKWYLGSLDFVPKHPFQFRDSMTVTDNGSLQGRLVYGALPNATDGIDATFGEVQLSPKPPAGTFDVRWTIPSTQGTMVNFKDVLTSAHPQNIYDFSVQPGSGGYPMTLRWNPSNLTTTGTYLLRDGATQGSVFAIDMRKQNSYVITNPSVTTVQIVHIGPSYFPFRFGWNIVSLPRTQLGDASKVHLFPTASSNAFLFDNGYFKSDTLKPGVGYWLKFPSSQTLGIDGLDRPSDTVLVQSGWNMIGTISKPLPVISIGQIPPGNVTSSFYQFSSGYATVDSLKPSRGYWVKTINPGKLILNGGVTAGPMAAPKLPLDELDKFIISDANGSEQVLFVARRTDQGIDLQRYELPPLPPGDIFDARFSSGRMVEAVSPDEGNVSVVLHAGTSPVTVRWELHASGGHPVSILDGTSGSKLFRSASPTGAFRITNPAVTRLTLAFEPREPVQAAFALHHNYPNPFNPTTNIAFDLPVQSVVSVAVYSILGQQVAVLMRDEQRAAGRHSIVFDGSGLSSGMYFVRIGAEGSDGRRFGDMSKMMLLK